MRFTAKGKERLVSLAEGPTSYVGGAEGDWQDAASCIGVGVDLFHPYDTSDFPNLKPAAIAKHSKIKFEKALKYCEACPVTSQCEEYAVSYGLQNEAVYGGRSPYDRGYKVGATLPAKDHPREKRIAAAAQRAFIQGHTFPEVRRLSDMGPGTQMPAPLVAWVKTFDREATTASWGDYRKSGSTGASIDHKAGRGWILSVDGTFTVALVLLDGVRRKRVYHLLRELTLSEDVQVRSLPRLTVWPEMYDYL